MRLQESTDAFKLEKKREVKSLTVLPVEHVKGSRKVTLCNSDVIRNTQTESNSRTETALQSEFLWLDFSLSAS